MREFRNGVGYYTKSTVEISFPEDDVCCYRCPLMYTEYGSKRDRCGRTGEILPAPRDMVGFDCPLKFTEEEH